MSTASAIANTVEVNYQLLKSIDFVQNNDISMSVPALISMIPELKSFYNKLYPNHILVHKVSIDTDIERSNVRYNFYIGDGIVKPDVEEIKRCFGVDKVQDNYGSYKVSISSEELNCITPMIYTDLHGDLWYIESPVKGLHLPEICLHYLIISALCNIMRYSPAKWNEILNNDISQQFSLLMTRYISLFEKKFPMLVLQQLSNYAVKMDF